jgi:predicted RNase H-like nuclease
MTAVGLDGFGKGWVAVCIDGAKQELHFLGAISELSAIKFDRACVDMPIGLPERGERVCDLEARALLRPHASRVFTGARRGLWDFSSHADANRALKLRGEKGVSIQLWHLGPKILEVDRFITSRTQDKIREAHPELVFRRLNDGEPAPSKHTPEGLALRVKLLRREGFANVKRWIDVERLGTGAKADDILDACAAAIAARDVDQGHVLPRGRAPRDARGLKMQIWF